MIENILLAFQGIWSHKLRSVLTMMGIIIGIGSIIAIVSTIKGTNEQIKQNLIGAGNNAVVVELCQGDYAFDLEYNSTPDGLYPVTDETLAAIEALPEVELASLYTERSYTGYIYHGDNTFSGALYGTDENYLEVNGYFVQRGRDFTKNDFANFMKVALIDEDAAAALFDGEDPLGGTIEIYSEVFTVVGVIAQSSLFEPVISSPSDYMTYMDTSSGMVLIPDSAWPMVAMFDDQQNVVLKAASTDEMTSAGKGAEDILNATLSGVDSSLNLSYKSEDLLTQATNLQALSESTNKQLIWIASISLLVGGIGVMNIMLVSVTERTKEIGLKKAIGAKRRRILWQFLTEAAVLTSLGGIIGVIAGIIMARVISNMSGTPVAIDVGATVIAVVFSMLIGIVFGLLPAVKAANLNPIDALRAE